MLAASPAALDRVRDDTVFRAADSDAWFEIWKTLSDHGPPPPAAVHRVTFSELFGQPRSFRGRPVAIAGTLRRLEVPLDSGGWQPAGARVECVWWHGDLPH